MSSFGARVFAAVVSEEGTCTRKSAFDDHGRGRGRAAQAEEHQRLRESAGSQERGGSQPHQPLDLRLVACRTVRGHIPVV